MSMIGDFGLCSQNNYDNMVKLINSAQFAEAENLIKEIHSEVEKSAKKLENDKCSGEVFIALFQYFKEIQGVDVRENIPSEGIGESWRETTGDFDIVAFYEKSQLLSLENTLDYHEISQFVTDFFETDYKNTGQIACEILFNNLKKAGTDDVLIWHLY